jgi:hypothetical protein
MFAQKMNTYNRSEFGQKKNSNKNGFGTKGFNSNPSSALKSVTNNTPSKPALQK